MNRLAPCRDWRGDDPPPPQGSVGRAEPLFGYVFDGSSDRSVGALADVLQRGLTAYIAEKPFRVEGKAFGTGAVLVRREGNPADLTAQIQDVASRWKVQVEAVSTSLAEDGPDLGGSHFPSSSPRGSASSRAVPFRRPHTDSCGTCSTRRRGSDSAVSS